MIYLIVIMALALAAAGGLVSCERTRANEAERGRASIQGQYDAYRISQEDVARREKEDNDRKEKNWNESNAENTGTITDLRNRLAVRVRDAARALVRPDGSTIRETACPGSIPDGVARQPVPAGPPEGYVSKADYVALEERSGRDVLRVVGLQRYVREVCLDSGG